MFRRSRYRRRNFQPAEKKSQLWRKLQSPPLQRRCYCNADGFFKLQRFLRKKTPAARLGSGYLSVQQQGLRVSTVPGNNKEVEVEINFNVTSFLPKAAAQVITSRVGLCYTNGIYTNHYATASEQDNLELWMNCLEAMDWEHTCSHTSGGEKYPLWRSCEQTSLSCENLDSWSGDDWRMEWFPDPDMMDLSYESCRE